MNGKELGGEEIEIVLAKPPDKKRKERQAARQTTRNSGWVTETWDSSVFPESSVCELIHILLLR